MTDLVDHAFVPMSGTDDCGQNIPSGKFVTACFYPKAIHRAPTELEQKNLLLELAWGVIANAGGGDWTKETQAWQQAAHSWGVKAGYRAEHPMGAELWDRQ